MADQPGGEPPYVTVILLNGLTENQQMGPWLRGRLVLAGVDLRTDLATWLDAVYALWIDQPGGDVLASAHRALVIATAKAAPDRETWGALPEQQALGVARMTGSRSAFGAPRQQ